MAKAIRPRRSEMTADSVTTYESQIMIDGQSYTHVQTAGHDYFLKTARPGSVLIEVRCRRPGTPANEPLEPKSRSHEFTEKLNEGCAKKDGHTPESFTFEQRENKTAKASQEATKPKERPDAKLYPPELDPHVLPDPTGPGSTFDPDQKRYY